MFSNTLLQWLSLCTALSTFARLTDAATCKPIPSSTDWPSKSDWTSLNQTVSGRLVGVVPPGAVCHSDWPQYNQGSCSTIASKWSSSDYHTNDAASVGWNDDTCYPSSTTSCSADGYPAYVIMAASAADVQAGVNFASRSGVRLVIKGTGHDFTGRSSGAGSLEINTHNIRGLTYKSGDSRATALGGSGSVKIFAGERMTNMYQFASQNGFTVVGGAESGVGIGGWISNGGHSPVSASLGLGADQVIEMEVVTADGTFRTINANSDSDLFWAMRGAGGSTFAVLISVTMRTFPSGSISLYSYTYSTTANSDTFFALAAYFHTQLPTLAGKGVGGYYYLYAGNGQITGTWTGYKTTAAALAAAVAPMENNMTTFNRGATVRVSSSKSDYASFASFWSTRPFAAVGQIGRLGSRLLDTKSLANEQLLNQKLRLASPGPWTGYGHLVAKPGVWSVPGGIAGGSNAVLPAWRTNIAHLIVARTWNPGDSASKASLTAQLRNTAVQALRDLAPDTGSYSNEGDPTEPNWQQTYFGTNYPQLLQIKNKFDPNGTFWCKACVGSENWSLAAWDGSSSEGVGQDKVRLCRVS